MVPAEYYSWDLRRRKQELQAPSTAHLCKTLVMENTRISGGWYYFLCAAGCSGNSNVCGAEQGRWNSRFYAIIVQYESTVSA